MPTLWEQEYARALRRLALAVVAVGVVWRVSRYLLAFPVWGDEAMLLVNYFTHDYRDLCGPIANCQVAPLLFHAAELTALRWLGSSEWAMRLPPFLACVGSVVLFGRLARLVLPPLGRTLAVAVFAVSIWPVTMGGLTKPYAFDLFFSLALLLPAVSWLRRPDRLARLGVLVLVAPVAVAASYPSVFIGGAVGLVLLPAVWRTRRPAALGLFALFGLLLVGAFVAHYRYVAVPHLRSPVNESTATTAQGMTDYWKHGFPPAAPLAFLRWFVLIHTGQVAAHPLGASNGGSALTAVLALVGLAWLWRHGRRPFVFLALASFGLWFVAAALHKYPYAASGRLSLHVAPFYCLLAGLGAAVLILRLGDATRRWRVTCAVCVVLALIGVGGTVRDIVRPWRDDDALWARQVAHDLRARADADPILTIQLPRDVNPVLAWQLGRLGPRVRWVPGVGAVDAPAGAGSFWVFTAGRPWDESADLESRLNRTGCQWRCAERVPSFLVPDDCRHPIHHCCLYHLVRDGD